MSAPEGAEPRERIVADLLAERDRQETKFPDQHLEAGTSSSFVNQTIRDMFREGTDVAAGIGTVTWKHVLREEVYEAFAEDEPDKLRVELVQVMAVAARWIEDIDRCGADLRGTQDG